MDALMSSEGGDVWVRFIRHRVRWTALTMAVQNPPASVVENCRREVDEATRVLSPTGVFLYL